MGITKTLQPNSKVIHIYIYIYIYKLIHLVITRIASLCIYKTAINTIQTSLNITFYCFFFIFFIFLYYKFLLLDFHVCWMGHANSSHQFSFPIHFITTAGRVRNLGRGGRGVKNRLIGFPGAIYRPPYSVTYNNKKKSDLGTDSHNSSIQVIFMH